MNPNELFPQESPTQSEVGFDYSVLDSEARSVVLERTTEIKSLMRRTVQDIFEIGQKLLEVKVQLGHGHFGNWLGAEFDWDERSARRFMSVAVAFKSDNLSDLSIAPSALYLLAAPSTPPTARTEALARARAGDFITYAKAKTLVSQLKTSTVPQPTKTKSSPTVDKPEVSPTEAVETQTIDGSASSLKDEGLGDRDIQLESDFSSSEMELADLTQKRASSPDQIRLISIEREDPSPSHGDVAGTDSMTIAVRLAIEGRPEALTTLFEQMQKNPSFASSVIGLALLGAESEGNFNEEKGIKDEMMKILSALSLF